MNIATGSGGKRTYSIPRWRFYGILLALGTANVIRDKMWARGYEPPPSESIQGWRKRNSVPANWVPALLEMALDEGIINSITDLQEDADIEAALNQRKV